MPSVIYRDVAAGGGWPAVPPVRSWSPGMRDARIARWQARLKASGDLARHDSASDLYDASLAARHRAVSIAPRLDGRRLIGAGTIEASTFPLKRGWRR